MSAGQLWRGTLTPREAEVAELVAEGASNQEIAAALFLSEQTVKFHVTNAMRSADVSTRGKLARWWWENVEMRCSIPLGWEGSD